MGKKCGKKNEPGVPAPLAAPGSDGTCGLGELRRQGGRAAGEEGGGGEREGHLEKESEREKESAREKESGQEKEGEQEKMGEQEKERRRRANR